MRKTTKQMDKKAGKPESWKALRAKITHPFKLHSLPAFQLSSILF
jgi:hypothetical protein